MAEEQTTAPVETTAEETPAEETAPAEAPAAETPPEATETAEETPTEEGAKEDAAGDTAMEATEGTTPAAEPTDLKSKIAGIDALRKLFIGGLNKETTEESLKEFFSQFGEISECTVIKDPNKISRGFGFITFQTVEEVDKCLESKTGLTLDERQIEVKRAIPKDGQGAAKSLRVYLGRVKEGITEENVKEYFEQNFPCTVESVELMRERAEGLPEGQEPRLRGFGFVTFDNSDTVDKVIIIRNHEINGVTITVNKAEPKSRNPGGGRGGWGGRGGFSGRGGYGGGYGGYGGYQRGGFRGGFNSNNPNSFGRYRPY